jgi:hypothetical protein
MQFGSKDRRREVLRFNLNFGVTRLSCNATFLCPWTSLNFAESLFKYCAEWLTSGAGKGLRRERIRLAPCAFLSDGW